MVCLSVARISIAGYLTRLLLCVFWLLLVFWLLII